MFRIPVSIALLVFSASAVASSDAPTILETAQTKQAERWAEVENYTITISVRDAGGLQTPTYYEKMDVDGQVTFRMVPPPEYYRRLNEQAGLPVMTPEAAEAYAEGLEAASDAMAAGGGDMPPMDMSGMTGQMSLFLTAGATAEVGDGRAEATEAVQHMKEFAGRARLVGTEPTVATSSEPPAMRDAYHLLADDLSDIEIKQPEDGGEFSLEKVHLWIDTEHYVPLRLLMEGTVEVDGKKTPISIEKLDLDYKQAGPLYESHQQVHKLSGLMAGMSDKDRKEMEKAKKEMEKAKAELEKMPEKQKNMVMKMMGSKMEELEKMIEADVITSITEVASVAINEGPPAPYGLGELSVSGGPADLEFPGALTVAAELDGGKAELAIVAGLPGRANASISLSCPMLYPESGEVPVDNAGGTVTLDGGAKVTIESGTGVITVTHRTPTHIVGTFNAFLKGTLATESGSESVDFTVSGKFDSGAPVSDRQALRGSPIPADLFEEQ